MKLQGRELKINLSGDDVRLLHSVLARLGVEIPQGELQVNLFGPGTHEAVFAFQALHDLPTTGIVDEATAQAIERELGGRQPRARGLEPLRPEAQRTVKGAVRHADGRPLTGSVVHVFDRDLRREQPLGESPTDEQGRYQVRYHRGQFTRAEKDAADLIVRAYTAKGDGPVAESSTLFNAGADATIDLVVGGGSYRGPSEYERLVAEVTPLLAEHALADLREDDRDNGRDKHMDVTFLSRETGLDSTRIALLIQAHRLFKDTDVPAEVFYGMFRDGLPSELPALLAQSPDAQRRALVRSADANTIPSRFGAEADAFVDRFKTLVVREAMKTPPDGGGATTLNDLLGIALPDATLREGFLSTYVGHTGAAQEFWKTLAEQPEFEERIPDVQLTLQLGALTGGHLPLVRELSRRLADDNSVSLLERFRSWWRAAPQSAERSVLQPLASLAEDDWLDIITQRGDDGRIGAPPGVPGKDDEERERNYARAIAHIVEDAFPTAFVARRLETDMLSGKDDLLNFFRANPDFDLTTTRLGLYTKDHPAAFANVTDVEGTTQRIRAMQRLYRLAPRYDQMSALMKSGLDSALRITRMGRNAFVRNYSQLLGGDAQAAAIYVRAGEVHDTALAFVADHGPHIGRVGLAAVPDEPVLDVNGSPEWSTLFGSVELCECEHCRSIHGPAAYFVDLLNFLQNRESKVAGSTVKDVLFARRPDLGEIELTCENTNTALPYVDLVNEVLENAVAPFELFTLPAAVEADLNRRVVSQALSGVFDPALSTEAVITAGARSGPRPAVPTSWTIEESGLAYTVRRVSNQLRVVERSIQTKGSEAERAASAQYVNARAYRRLGRAVYPWSLPFSLPWEEAKVYLAHLGMPRHRIMEVFRAGDRAAILNDVAIAHEYLVLSHEIERDGNGTIVNHHGTAPIVTGVTTADPDADAANRGVWNLWGFATENLTAHNSIADPSDRTRGIAGGHWLEVLGGRVDVFLQQSQLKYRELLDLLDTYYVNPTAGTPRAIRIVAHAAAPTGTCETDRLRLEGFDQAAAARTVRFLRLWRALGWSMRDLDRAITAFHPAHFADPNLTTTGAADNNRFLVQLAHVQRLHATLNVPVVRLLGWWAVIDSNTYIDHHAPGQPRAASLYDQLFRNRATISPLDPAFTENPSGLNGTLSGHTAAITAALGITGADFALMLGDANIVPPDPADNTRPDDRLTLDHLSRLHRHASLAQALRLPVRDYLIALNLISRDPFATSTDTVMFVETVEKVGDADFTFAELDYLLRHTFAPESTSLPTDEAVATFLSELRSGLQKIAEQNTFRAADGNPAPSTTRFDPTEPTLDLDGDLTRQKLAMLNWDRDLVEEAVATLAGTVAYEATLAALPGGVVLPSATAEQGELSYDAGRQRLRFTGPMTDARKQGLDAVSGDVPYQAAVQALYDKPRQFIERAMRTFAVHDFVDDLADLPAKVTIPTALKQKVYFDAAAGRLHCLGVMSERERDTLLALSTDAMDPNHDGYRNAVNGIFDQAAVLVPGASDAFLTSGDAAAFFDGIVDAGDRFLHVLERLLPHLRTTLSEQLVVQKTAEAIQLETRSTDALLRTRLTSPLNPQRSCLAELLDPAFADSHVNVPLTPTGFPAQFRTYVRVHKAAFIASRFTLTHRQLAWLFDYGPGDGWLDLNAVPTDAQEPAAAFDGWLRVAELTRLRDSLPRGESALDEILGLGRALNGAGTTPERNGAKRAWFDSVTRWTRWTPADLETLIGPADDHTQTGVLDASLTAYVSVRLLIRLREAFGLLKRLGIPAQQAGDLAVDHITLARSRAVRQAVRAKYDEAQWLAIAKPLHDVLRAKQRASLVAYLVAHLRLPDGPRDADDLFAHFLIDVEMDPCMLTSRIKQAISSVQLFVQRCFLNLQPDVAASAEVDERWHEWKWMKQYRVWEANRKIFLYPENWIEPELRDDKSPFFRELESELLQSDLTAETAEETFLHYLEKLDQVARLQVVGIHHQLEKDRAGNTAVDILHVFARTPGTPHVYFYRQRVDSSYWTPWERVDLDIEGDHLIPAVWNRRLLLFWPMFNETADPVTITAGTLSGGDLTKYWEIKLAWSERKHGQWTAKRLSSQPLPRIPFGSSGFQEDRSLFFCRTLIDNANSLYVLILSEPILTSVLQAAGNKAPAFRFDGCNAEPVVDGFATYSPDNSNAWRQIVEPVTGTTFYRTLYREQGDQPLSLPAPTDTAVLRRTPGTFLLVPHSDGSSLTEHPFFFQDDKRVFFVIPSGRPVPTLEPDANQVDPGSATDVSGPYLDRVGRRGDLIGPTSNAGDPSLFEPSFPVMGAASTMAMVGSAMAPVLSVSSMRTARGTGTSNSRLYTYRPSTSFRFQSFYHPYVCTFVRELNRNGVDGLLQRRLQVEPDAPEFALRKPDGQPVDRFDFDTEYMPYSNPFIANPDPIVLKPYPREDVDFGTEFGDDGAYALYNWELFFHAPLLIADRLNKNQRYEDAQKWFHYIFDPTDTSSFEAPQRYWRTRPFHVRARDDYQRQRIERIFNPQDSAELNRFRQAVARWRQDPFKPHLVARMRTTAYQKTVVMKYIDNLIAWGDQLFRRDTIESNNEATQLYILAAEILGRRPEDVPPRATSRVQTYNSLEPYLDDFSNALVQIEDYIPPSAGGGMAPGPGIRPAPTLPAMLYFCVPKNDRLLGYWDTVADRLFKLRHCMNIEGVVRRLPLFEPPIDPGLLVKAVAAGVDLGSVLTDVSAGPPYYRFNILAQKASELCSELKSVGQAVLSALEKRDAEQLSLLRAQQESALLTLVEQVRKLQSDEAEQQKTALSRSRDTVVSRFIHFQKLLGVQSPQVPGMGEPIAETSPSAQVAVLDEGGTKLIRFEQEQLEKLKQSSEEQLAASSLDLLSAILTIVPNLNIAPFGVGGTFGGVNLGSAASFAANILRTVSAQHSYEAGRAGQLGQYSLRAHDWLLQSNQAAREIVQIDQQFLAADLRSQIAAHELSNHRKQRDAARDVEDLLKDKYTNQELYGWMIGQLTTVYFQTYQLAYDLAKGAERAFRHELGLRDSNFIQFGYWDSLKRGLLAGERLFHDLKGMEVAYLEQHRREYEITKSVSLRELDPVALVQLRQTGSCLLTLPEVVFDLDYPGHYMRRIRSASVTIPCVTGPYTGVNCTLTLLNSTVRHANTLLGGDTYARQEGDPRFTDSLGAIQSIVTSSAQNDSGLFEASLRDERYLPFEGAGAISTWQLELPAGFRRFDYDTIADAILHLRYTAREGGGLLRQQSTLELQTAINDLMRTEGQRGLAQVFTLRHEFPTEWHRFLNPVSASGDQTSTLALTRDRFPFIVQDRQITVGKIDVFIRVPPDFVVANLRLTMAYGNAAPGPAAYQPNDLLALVPWKGALRAEKTFNEPPGNWTITAWLDDSAGPRRISATAVRDVVLVCHYAVG